MANKSIQNFRAALNSVVNGVDARLNGGKFVRLSKKHGRRSRRNPDYPRAFTIDSAYVIAGNKDQLDELTAIYGNDLKPASLPEKAKIRLRSGTSAILQGERLLTALTKGAAIEEVLEEGVGPAPARPAPATAPAPAPAPRPVAAAAEVSIFSFQVGQKPSSAVPTIEQILPRFNLANFYNALDSLNSMDRQEVDDAAKKYELGRVVGAIINQLNQGTPANEIRIADPAALVPMLEKLTQIPIRTWRELYFTKPPTDEKSEYGQVNVAWITALLSPNIASFVQTQSGDGAYYLKTAYGGGQTTLLQNMYVCFDASSVRAMREIDIAHVKEVYKQNDINPDSKEAKAQISRLYYEPGHLLRYLGWPAVKKGDLGLFVQMVESLAKVERSSVVAPSTKFKIVEQDQRQGVATGPYVLRTPPAPSLIMAKDSTLSREIADQIAGGLARTWIDASVTAQVKDFLTSKGVILRLDPARCPPDIQGALRGSFQTLDIE